MSCLNIKSSNFEVISQNRLEFIKDITHLYTSECKITNIMLQWLQNYPDILEKIYDLTYQVLRPFKGWLIPGGLLEKYFIAVEKGLKVSIFNCKMCGQCILHSTGMTCPMNCPKHLRNGPCGGVRPDGYCEVKPEMLCVWTTAYGRSLRMSRYGNVFADLQPPLNNQLKGSSSWINLLHGIDADVPSGWIKSDDISGNFHEENHAN